MICATLYTPERMNPLSSCVSTPLSQFKTIDVSVPNPVVKNGMFFSKNEDDHLVAYSERSGDILWTSEVNDLWLNLPMVFDGFILEKDFSSGEAMMFSQKNGSLVKNLGVSLLPDA